MTHSTTHSFHSKTVTAMTHVWIVDSTAIQPTHMTGMEIVFSTLMNTPTLSETQAYHSQMRKLESHSNNLMLMPTMSLTLMKCRPPSMLWEKRTTRTNQAQTTG